MTPNALIRINNGIGFFTFGMSITIWLLVYIGMVGSSSEGVSGAIILADVNRMGFELSSDTEWTSQE
jgi:hypothetical protein